MNKYLPRLAEVLKRVWQLLYKAETETSRVYGFSTGLTSCFLMALTFLSSSPISMDLSSSLWMAITHSRSTAPIPSGPSLETGLKVHRDSFRVHLSE